MIKMCSSWQPRPIAIFLLSSLLLVASAQAQPLSSSQSKTLLRLPRILEYPPALAGWTKQTDFCSLPSSPSLAVACSGGRLTELAIVGDRPPSPDWRTALSSAFSADSLFTTLASLPGLTALSLVSLGIWGPLPAKVDRFAATLKLLNLSSNYFYATIPPEISKMTALQTLALSRNLFNGTAPDLRPLPLLEALDLSWNRLGPDFPSLGESLVSVDLRNNTFRGKIPPGLASLDRLQRLDVSANELDGWIPPSLLALPSIHFLDLSGNQLTGELPANLSCGNGLGYVDVSNNRLFGELPSCVRSNDSNRVVLDSGNCLVSGDSRYQHPNSYCNAGALAAILPPPAQTPASASGGSKSSLSLVLGIVGGILGGVLVLGLLLFVALRKARAENPDVKMFKKPVAGKTLVQLPPRTPADARHMAQAVRIGTIGLTPYHVFSMEELEEATNGFDQSNLIAQGPQGQVYRGWVRDGSTVVVRCLKLKQKYPPTSLHQYMNVISRLRHRNLVSILGGHYSVTGMQDNANAINTIYLVFEYVSNGTLRSHLTEWRKREMLKWPQRIAAVIGVARGIQFLHTVTVPGIVGNDLSMENILLDETLTAKISNYSLPMVPKHKDKVGCGSPFAGVEDSDLGSIRNLEQGEKEDVYQLGLIILEIITGRPAGSQSEFENLKARLQKGLTDGSTKLRGLTDSAIGGTFAFDSLRTVVEVALNCLSKDPSNRPSIEDVLWNLQYSVQVQDGWASSENLSGPC